jgi:small-conductance mechanosensitive channel
MDSELLSRAEAVLGEYLPRLGAALLLLIIGLLLARLLGRIASRVLRAAGGDDLAQRFGVDRFLARVGLNPSLAAVIGRSVRLAVRVVTVVAAVATLGLRTLDASLNAAVLFLPRVFVAAILLVVGVAVGEWVRARVDRLADTMDLGGPLGRLSEGVVVTVFATTALAELGVPLEILVVAGAIVLGAVALALALAFGLGSRDVARQISAGRSVKEAFKLGDAVTFGDVRGEIVSLGNAAALLRTTDGRTLRVPNHVLVESIVTVEAGDAGEEPPAP